MKFKTLQVVLVLTVLLCAEINGQPQTKKPARAPSPNTFKVTGLLVSKDGAPILDKRVVVAPLSERVAGLPAGTPYVL